jgi:hypothetical protein
MLLGHVSNVQIQRGEGSTLVIDLSDRKLASLELSETVQQTAI